MDVTYHNHIVGVKNTEIQKLRHEISDLEHENEHLRTVNVSLSEQISRLEQELKETPKYKLTEEEICDLEDYIVSGDIQATFELLRNGCGFNVGLGRM